MFPHLIENKTYLPGTKNNLNINMRSFQIHIQLGNYCYCVCQVSLVQNGRGTKEKEFMDIPTLGAPSCNTTSAFHVFSSFSIATLHLSVVMSSCRAIQPGTVLMGKRSTPEISK